jgi:hypothetical protein
LWIRLIRLPEKGDYGYLVDLSSPVSNDGDKYATLDVHLPGALRSMQQVAQHKWLDRRDLGTGTMIVYVVFLSFGSKECMQDGPIHSVERATMVVYNETPIYYKYRL